MSMENNSPQHPADIRRMFSDIAPVYDRLNRLLSLGLDRLWRRKMVKMALRDLDRKERLLDVCTGTGDLLQDFERAGVPSVTGVDFSFPMLRVGLDRFRHRPGFYLAQADALSLPFPDASFDIASNSFGLRNLAGRLQGLCEMVRVVKPGGKVAILEFSPIQSWWMRPLYYFYLRLWVPIVGNFVSSSTAYAYLKDSIRDFPAPDQIREWMHKAGVEEIETRLFCGGIAVAYVGRVGSEGPARTDTD
jgi:demethylmenaquinone methyltransferase / 2-methoxy-6-polyprenyl-1,4-benzoquinol methylase